MSYPEFVNTLKELKIKKKARMPKVSPQKFYPAKIELQLQELLRETFTAFAKRLEATAPAGLSLDSIESVSQIEWEPDDEFNVRLSNLASGVSSFNVMAFADFTDLVVGERYFPTQDRKQEILKTWKDNFIELCRSTNTEMKKKVAGVVSDAVLNGTNLRDMVKKIQQTCSTFSRSKAELIATTEVGKLNSAIARNQSESDGIDYYEWAAAMDGRTRESHAVMDGRICKWGDDTGYYVWKQGKDGKRKLTRRDRPKNAYIGAPGTDFRCRCTALPYVPEYEDDYKREEGPVRGVTQGKNKDAETIARIAEVKENERKKSVQSSLSRSFKLLNEKNKGVPKEKTPVYVPFDYERSIWVDSKRLLKYKNELSSNKKRKEGDERDKFEKEVKMAEYLREAGLGTILVEENHGSGHPNPDAVVNGKIAEFKQVKGSPERVKDRIRDAIDQGAEIIGIEIVKKYPVDSIFGYVKEATKNHKGKIVYLRISDKTYRYESI